MLTLAGDSNSDLRIDAQGNLVLLTDQQALADKIDQRLKLFYQEWFLDTSRGVPYFQNILGDTVNSNVAAALISKEIQKEASVLNLTDVQFQLDNKTRQFVYKAIVKTIYGEIGINKNGTS